MTQHAREAQGLLRQLGWPIKVDGVRGDRTYSAIRDFQEGFAWWDLLIDGHAGPKSTRALRYAVAHQGRCSPHFRFAEWKSHGNGWIKVNRSLVRGLEEYRDRAGATAIVSGYRDPAYNDSLPGAASNSIHLYGGAADLIPKLTVAQVRAMRRFSGIGYQGATGLVRHVDVRGQDHVPNTTGGTRDNPTIWIYD